MITGNATVETGAIHGAGNSSLTITNCSITDNTGGGIASYDSSLTITNCSITDNTGRGINCYNSPSLTISDSMIARNSQRGIQVANSSSASITNCTITGNTTEWGGAGIEFVNSSPTVTNCIISNNTATLDGAGIRCLENSSPTITNCTISNNTASGSGGAIYINDNSSPTVKNSILWGDAPEEISIDTGTISVTYSDIQGGWLGESNIDADPLFVGGGDYHLTAGSPSIDTGTSEDAPSTDIEGTTRPQGNGYDMGAYEEFIIPGDIDYSETIDLRDAILALQVCIGIAPTSAIHKEADVNGDNRIGLEEAIHALQVVAGRYNHPPELNPIGNKSVDKNSELSFSISGSDADGDTLTYSASNLPNGATFNPGTRTFSWIPTDSQSGPYDVTFTVTDIFGALDSETIRITVIHVSVVEEWEYILDGGQGNGNMILTGKQDGTISVEGSWGYGPVLTEPHIHRTVEGSYSDCLLTIDGSSISFTCQGTAQDNSVPPEYPEYMVSSFTLTFSGTTNNGQGSGTYTITFTNPGWTPSISGNWVATRTSGSGITE
jgi:parallel beta-helix repeat protein